MSAVSDFYNALTAIETYEKQVKEGKALLREWYEILVAVCPHSKAVECRIKNQGKWRICKICGVEDRASVGGTAGDEYNYGYPGSYDSNFWIGSEIEVVNDEAKFFKHRRSHTYEVRGGKVVDPFNKS